MDFPAFYEGPMTVRGALLVAVFAVAALRSVPAQAQQPAAAATPYFEFQVERPARFVGDTLRPRPAADRFAARSSDRSALIVQFVVDTMGTPVPGTFHVLKAPSRALADSAAAAMSRWRFEPARVDGHVVAQLVQTSIDYD
jgi:outer membrane biosynthesis protein TonB